MKIVIDISWFWAGADHQQLAIRHWLLQLIQHRGEDTFLCLTQKGQSGPIANRVEILSLLPQNQKDTGKWYQRKLPALLEQQQAGAFMGRPGWISERSAVPQWLWLQARPGTYPAGTKSWWARWQYRKQLPLQLQRAAIAVTTGSWHKERWLESWPLLQNSIQQLPPLPVDDMGEIDWREQQSIRDQYCAGRNYFLVQGPFTESSNVISTLRGFSQFKKRQKSDWKLVLCGGVAHSYAQLHRSLDTYKYKADVQLFDQLPATEQSRLVQAAYALIIPAQEQVSSVVISQAWAAATPLLLPADEANKKDAGNTAIYADMDQHTSIADQMMRLYKDEELHTRLRQAAREKHLENGWPVVMQWMDKQLGQMIAVARS